MAEDGREFTVVYDVAPGRCMVPVTGAYGGPTPDGASVVAHLFVEHATVPSLSSHAVTAGGEVNLGNGQHIRRADLTREVQTTVVLSPEQAISVGQWLTQKGQEAVKARRSKGKDK